ncbi:MAG TPA: PLDc N-terminal domain-containing protein [Cryomorphaceae bacterium]|nr:PLDc N-terminal domain-containing protein [Cryomorphaceae bacterium]
MILLNIFAEVSVTVLVILAIIALLLPIIALIDIVKNDFSGANKVIWVVVVLFLPILGSILYFLIGRNHKINT